MTRKQTVILIALIVFVVAGIVFGLASRKNKKADENSLSQGTPVPDSTADSKKYYIPEVPKGAELTKPVLEAPAAPNAVKEKVRVFEMKINKDGYSPNNFTVNLGDIVNIKITSVDGDYDFNLPSINSYFVVKRGEIKTTTFGATSAGTWNFSCRDYCPSGKIIKGTIVVIP